MQIHLLRSFVLLFLTIIIPHKSDAQVKEWCIADTQAPDSKLQGALDYACGQGADCSNIQPNQSCYEPNTVKDHASYAMNSYYQKFKKNGGTCDFNGAAVIIQTDPSHDSCHFDSSP